MLFKGKKFDEKNLIINCNPSEAPDLLDCNVAMKDENDRIIPIGPFKLERMRTGEWRILEKPPDLTVEEEEQIKRVLFTKYLPKK